MNEEEMIKEIEKHKEDMLKSDVQYWIKRYDIKYQQNKENYDKLKECEHQLQSYKAKEDKLRELIEAPIDNMSLNWQSKLILAILNEGDKE